MGQIKLMHNVTHRNILCVLSRRRMQRLGACKITQVDFLPKEVMAYCKETQTPLTANLSEGEYLCTCVCGHEELLLTLHIIVEDSNCFRVRGAPKFTRSNRSSQVAMIVVVVWLNLMLFFLDSSQPVNL